jgi:nicotinamidase-related amidase
MNPIDLKHTALVVVDVQNDYFPGGRFVLFRPRAALKKVLQLRDWARNRGITVFWVRHTGTVEAKFFRPGTPGRELHQALEPRADEPIINKAYPNSFLDTDLQAQLDVRGIQTVVWAGMMTWMCIDTSVRSAKERGFRNLLAHDACASGWLTGPQGPVTPWSAHRAFVAALSFHHAELSATKALVRY